MTIRAETKTTLTITHGATLAELQQAISDLEVPSGAKLDIKSYTGDAREPGYSTIVLRWTP